MNSEEKPMKLLREAFERRWKNLVRKAEEIDRLRVPNKGVLWNIVRDSWRKGFRCAYCGRKMLIKDPEHPHGRSFSLDHKVPIDLGGDNSLENFAVACHRCNIIKGTLRAETYKRLLEEDKALLDDRQFLDQMFSEMWDGRLAEKLNRERARSW